MVDTKPGPALWPIWATAAHVAGARAYISQTLGIHGLEEIDVWSGRARLVQA